MSILSPTTCGFAKVGVYDIMTTCVDKATTSTSTSTGVAVPIVDVKKENYQSIASAAREQQFQEFNQTFNTNNGFNVQYRTFVQTFKKIIKNINDLSRNKRMEDQKIVLEKFSRKHWENLKEDVKSRHTLYDCQGCLEDPALKAALGSFLISKNFKKVAAENNIVKLQASKESTKSSTKKASADRASAKKFVEERVPLSTLKVYNDLIRAETVKDINATKRSTCVQRTFGGGISLKSFNEHRIVDSFEPKKEAYDRARKLEEDINQGIRKPHDHVGNIEKYVWQSKECLEHVNNLDDGEFLNFSDLARNYGLKEKDDFSKDNKNQVVKEFLMRSGVDLKRFKHKRRNDVNENESINVRRKKKKLSSSKISVPSDPTLSEIYKDLHAGIQRGQYSMGEIIVPQKFKKCVVTKDGKLEWEEFTVGGRKTPLKIIREDTHSKHKEFYRILSDDEIGTLSSDEVIHYLRSIDECSEEEVYDEVALKRKMRQFQRKRHLAVWHDGATICNHNHVLFTCCELYDKAIHLTDEEAFKKYGMKVDVQGTIEKPEMYMFVRCPGTVELTAYSETRLEDLVELREPLQLLEKGVEIQDIMRFFKGDGPSCQFESGHQKGGNYFCWLCGIKHINSSDYAHSLYRKYKTLKDCQILVLQTLGSRKRSKEGVTKLYHDLSRLQLMDELDERGIIYSSFETLTSLRDKLIKEMEGIQRVPSLLFTCPEQDLTSVGLKHYEILGCEPLHDIGNHIKNLFCEIPEQVDKRDKNNAKEFIDIVFAGKDSKRGVDYRSNLIKVYLHFKDIYPDHPVTSALFTLCEIQRVLYVQESERTSSLILHLYLQIFLHVMSIKKFHKITSMTERRFFGKYFHAIISHAADQFRIINGRSLNAENEERFFKSLKHIANRLSNHHPDNVISHGFLRTQVREDFKDDDAIIREEASISKMYKSILLKIENSMIPFFVIENYPWDYQALLEKIADYLLAGTFWTEVSTGIVFNDMSGVNSPKVVHHFRSYSMADEMLFVQNCWENCLYKADEVIPAFKIKVEDSLGNTLIRKLNTLNYDIHNSFSDVTDASSEIIVDTDNVSLNMETEANMSTVQEKIMSTPKVDKQSTPLMNVSLTENHEISNKKIWNAVDSRLDMSADSFDSSIHFESLTDSTQNLIETNNAEDVAQIVPVILSNSSGSNDATVSTLYRILGKHDLIEQYTKIKTKYEKYHDAMYYDEYLTSVAKLEILLNHQRDVLKKELGQIQRRKLQKNCASLDLVPTSGKDKEDYEEIMNKLSEIQVLKATLNNF